jgi:site-specific DNA recombinase
MGMRGHDIDRLTRDNRHLEDCIEVVQHLGWPIIDITDTLDLLTNNGRTIARILVATYNKQSADTARGQTQGPGAGAGRNPDRRGTHLGRRT